MKQLLVMLFAFLSLQVGAQNVTITGKRPLQNLTHSLSFLFLSTIGSPAVYIFDF